MRLVLSNKRHINIDTKHSMCILNLCLAKFGEVFLFLPFLSYPLPSRMFVPVS